MSLGSYAVVFELGLQAFDDPRAARRAAGDAVAELRSLAKADQRVRATRIRRRGSGVVEVSIVVEATTWRAAFELSRTLLHRAVHGTGVAAAGWDDLRPELRRPPLPPLGTTASHVAVIDLRHL